MNGLPDSQFHKGKTYQDFMFVKRNSWLISRATFGGNPASEAASAGCKKRVTEAKLS